LAGPKNFGLKVENFKKIPAEIFFADLFLAKKPVPPGTISLRIHLPATSKVTHAAKPSRGLPEKQWNKRVARSRFELLSRDPESRMIDRYTTGLCCLILFAAVA
jgi:hypothetical protein